MPLFIRAQVLTSRHTTVYNLQYYYQARTTLPATQSHLFAHVRNELRDLFVVEWFPELRH